MAAASRAVRRKMPLPTCELQAKKPHMVQTVVMKVVGASSALLDTHYKSLLWNGAGATAHIEIDEIAANGQQGQYLVLTNQTVCEEMALAERLRKGLQQLPGSPQVEWVRPLTRRLQRLFGWGDVATTRNDVACAAKAGDLQEQRKEQKASDAVAPNGVHYKWHPHVERPLSFYVTDQDKVADEEKVLWLRQELGSDATLSEFCAKFVELLGLQASLPGVRT